jgi:Domain of unknown function (DUF4646)
MFRRRKQKSDDDQVSDHGDENIPPPTGSDSNDNDEPPQNEDGELPQVDSPIESKGFLRGLFAKGQPKRDPLDPPPECFSRPAQLPQGPLPFTTFEVACNGRLLDAGWPQTYPSDILPAHDIQEPEWIRFLEDLALTACLTPRNRIVSHVIPMAMGVGLYGILISNAIRRIMKRGKANGVASVVDIWNGCYFQLRGVKVTLMRREKTLSGLEASEESSSSSSSDSSSDEDSTNQDESWRARRERKRQEKEKRKEQEKQKEEQQEEQQKEDQQEGKERTSPYYLVVESQPIDSQP